MAKWNIVFRPKENAAPLIGKFGETVDFQSAKKPIKMFFEEEDIIEEMEELAAVGYTEAEYRKKKKINKFRPRSQLIIEDSTYRAPNGPPNGLQYIGQRSNHSFEDVDEPKKPADAKTVFKTASGGSSADHAFKYVLLEFANKPGGPTEVNMIPVGDWYNFKKPGLTGQMLLDDVDDAFEQKLKHDKAAVQKYRRLAASLETVSTNDVKKDAEDLSAPDVFGRAVSKAIRRGTFGKANIRKHLEDIDAGPLSNGDYTKVHADDDEEFVGAEQALLDEREDNFAGKDIRGVLESFGVEKNDDLDEDSENDGDEEENSGSGSGGGKGKDPTVGMLSDEIDDSSKRVGMLLSQKRLAQQEDHIADSSPEGVVAAKRVRSEAPGTGSNATGSVSESSVEVPDTRRAVELTEDCVRSYLASMGGKATIASLMKYFKAARKNHSGGGTVGSQILSEIVKKCAVIEDDAVLGRIVKLRG